MMKLLLALVLLVLVCALVFYTRPLVAQGEGDVPVAAFACNAGGTCVTTQEQLDRMMAIWYAMQRRILECPRVRPAPKPGERET